MRTEVLRRYVIYTEKNDMPTKQKPPSLLSGKEAFSLCDPEFKGLNKEYGKNRTHCVRLCHIQKVAGGR
jgi:hypothetical protein